jgi:hypothetical protein
VTRALVPGLEEDGIRCLVCNRVFRALASHVVRTHGYASTQSYREEFGITNRGLVCSSTHELMAANAHRTKLGERGSSTRVTLDSVARQRSVASRQERAQRPKRCAPHKLGCGKLLPRSEFRILAHGNSAAICRECERKYDRARRRVA